MAEVNQLNNCHAMAQRAAIFALPQAGEFDKPGSDAGHMAARSSASPSHLEAFQPTRPQMDFNWLDQLGNSNNSRNTARVAHRDQAQSLAGRGVPVFEGEWLEI